MVRELGLSLFSFLVVSSALAVGPVDDVPMPGYSTFDRFIEKLGGEIPWPIGELTKKFQEHTRSTVTVFGMNRGRSLHRFSANERHPRILIGSTSEAVRPGIGNSRSLPANSSIGEGEMFISYVEQTNTLEVISFNRSSNRFEFQILKNYERGSKPTVILSCPGSIDTVRVKI